jgi:hypothetical protein
MICGGQKNKQDELRDTRNCELVVPTFRYAYNRRSCVALSVFRLGHRFLFAKRLAYRPPPWLIRVLIARLLSATFV